MLPGARSAAAASRAMRTCLVEPSCDANSVALGQQQTCGCTSLKQALSWRYDAQVRRAVQGAQCSCILAVIVPCTPV